MGDDERGAVLEQLGQGRLNELLALGVEIAGGLVEDQDFRVGEDRAGNGEAWRCPPESLNPLSPISVSYFSGIRSMKPWALAASGLLDGSSLASRRP